MKKEIDIPCVGYNLKADWYEGSSTDEIIFMMLGYDSSKSRYSDLTNALVEKTGASALVLDYSGHGESPFVLKDLTPAQNLLEVLITFDWIVEKYPDARINVVSCSYGGYLSAFLTKYRNFNKLVMRVPAIYKESDLYSKWGSYSQEEGRIFRVDASNFVNHVALSVPRKFDGPTFVVTHEYDGSCPKSTTDAYIDAFDACTWEAEGFEHSFTRSNVSNESIEEYINKIAEWLKW